MIVNNRKGDIEMKQLNNNYYSYKVKVFALFVWGMILLLPLSFFLGCNKQKEYIQNQETEKVIESVEMVEKALTLYAGDDQYLLEVSVFPIDAEYSEIEWTSSDQNVVTVSEGLLTPISAGTAEIKATINGKTCSCSVNVYELIIEELSIEKMPDKTELLWGDKLTLDGLILKGKMNNGKEKLFDSGFTADTEYLDELGEKNITVTLQNCTVNVNITVKEPVVDSIRIASEPNQKEYVVNSFFDPAGLTVEVVYENGKTNVISEGFEVGGGQLSVVGTQTINVKLGEKTTSLNVTVVPRAISSISVKKYPNQLWVPSGSKNNPSGLVLTAVYNDGTTETVEKGYTVYPEVFGAVGQQNVTVYYGGAVCSYAVRVDEPKIYQFYCKKHPNKMNYFVGETFDPTGIEMLVWYDNGVQMRITEGFDIERPTFTSRGAWDIKITYQGSEDIIRVIVSDVTVSSLKVTTLPAKMDYQLGDRFDPTGVVLTAYYNNGTSEVITSGFTYDDMTFSHYGESWVGFKYKEGQTYLTVNIEKPPAV